jgi:hypothetical protein
MRIRRTGLQPVFGEQRILGGSGQVENLSYVVENLSYVVKNLPYVVFDIVQ